MPRIKTIASGVRSPSEREVWNTLQVTPAMEAGIADHVWSLVELVGLLVEKSVGVAA